MAQQCTSCRHESPDGAKFCLECGTPFARSCPSCGSPVSGGKFCGECGAPLPASAAPGPAPAAPSVAGSGGPVSERRTTSVLFGDLVSFTTLSESRDPEEVRELLSEYFAVARTVVGRYGGTIEKFIGDAVMAVWGVPVSREDDAERAVRAGLDLVGEVAALGARVGAPGLSMRVGITTGSVAVTLGAVNEGMVAGDAVNTAARVQTAAEPGTVWVDPETRGLTAAAIAFTDMGDHTLKGKAEPARLYRADAIVAAVGGAQRVDGLEAPMTGRDVELRRVKELFHATEQDGRARICVVTGMAGVGKSRLGWEFEKYTDGLSDGHWWHRGRCLSYGDGVAFWAFAEMMRMRLGLLEGDDGDAVLAKVVEATARFAADATEAAWMTPRLAALLDPSGGLVFERTDLFAAWTTFLERVGSDGDPVVLLFEDFQHADSGLLDLVEHLLETCRAHLFVLVLTRPELLQERPSLVAGRRASVVSLEPLDDDDMATLVDALVADLPERARAAVVARAEGVPLYAVETVRSLIDRDAVVAREGRYAFVDHDNMLVDLDQLAAPTSLQMLIAARLDSLTAVERRTVQDASVLGLSFRHTGLMALDDVSSYDLDAALQALQRKGVIAAEGDPRSPEHGQYRFLQALVREVAYSTLARKDRRARHLAAADHLEAESEATSEALAGIIAQHLLDALEASTSYDEQRPAIAARARARLTAAAARAEALGSPAEALASALTALTLDPDPDETAALQEVGARTALLAGTPAQSEELAGLARTGYDELRRPHEAVRALVVQASALAGLGRIEESSALLTDGQVALDALDAVDPRVQFALLAAASRVSRAQGNVDEQTRHALQQMRIAEQLDDPTRLVEALNAVGILLIDAGGPTAYLALMERCIVLAREGHVIEQLGRSLSNLLSEVYLTDLTHAVEIADEAATVSQKVGNAYFTEIALTNTGFVWLLSGDWDRAEAELTAWLTDHDPTSSTGPMWLVLGLIRAARGRAMLTVTCLESDEPYEQTFNVVARARATAGDDLTASAARAAEALTAYTADAVRAEDFEMLWAAVVELQLHAGDLETAARMLSLADPVLEGRRRPLLEAEQLRFRAMVAASRDDAQGAPEIDFRAAVLAHQAYGSSFLMARSQHELARWLVDRGRIGEASTLLEEARAVYLRLGAQPLLDDLDTLGAGSLADREPVSAR